MHHCNQVPFTDTEYDELAYLLTIVQNELVKGVFEIESLQPGTTIAEKMRLQAESACIFRERIEAR